MISSIFLCERRSGNNVFRKIKMEILNYVSKEYVIELLSVALNNLQREFSSLRCSIIDGVFHIMFDEKGYVRRDDLEEVIEDFDIISEREAVDRFENILRMAHEASEKAKADGILRITREYLLENADIRIRNENDMFGCDSIICKKYLDLDIYVSVKLPDVDYLNGYVAYVDDLMLQRLGVLEEEVYEAAMKNLDKYAVELCVINSDGFHIDLSVKEMAEKIRDDEYIIYVKNSMPENGATVLLKEEILESISEELRDDLILLPADKTEWVILPMGKAKAENMDVVSDYGRYVLEVNIEELTYGERLSNNVYVYYSSRNELVNVTNSTAGLNDGEIGAALLGF